MCKISVIVPIYNVDKYLSKCIQSISNQSYNNLEIILVNDGSTDNSLSIAQYYANKDKRIIIYSQQNKGLSEARNSGLKISTGDYISFIDGDDWIEDKMLETMLTSAIQNNSDFVCCHLQYDNIYNQKTTNKKIIFEYEILENNEILKDTLLVRNIKTSVVIKLYNKIFLTHNNIYFYPGIINEDSYFSIIVAFYAQKVSFTNYIFYHAIERNDSISREFKDRNITDLLFALNKQKLFLESKNVYHLYSSYFQAGYIKAIAYTILQAAQRLKYKSYCKLFYKYIKTSHFLSYNKKSNRKLLSFNHKCVLILSKYPRILYIIFNLINKLGIRMH